MQEMAFGPRAFHPTNEGTNYARLCRLLVDVGTQVLRDTFDRIHSPATLDVTLTTPPTLIILQSLRKKGVLNPSQWEKLYPPATTSPSVSSTNFDITLLTLLQRHICHLRPPASTGNWDALPLGFDNSTEANIARIKYYRNNVCAHASQAAIDDPAFNALWDNISNALLALGSSKGYATVVTRLKTECMDADVEEHYRKVLRKRKKENDSLKDKLEELQEMLNQFMLEERSDRSKLGKIEAGDDDYGDSGNCGYGDYYYGDSGDCGSGDYYYGGDCGYGDYYYGDSGNWGYGDYYYGDSGNCGYGDYYYGDSGNCGYGDYYYGDSGNCGYGDYYYGDSGDCGSGDDDYGDSGDCGSGDDDYGDNRDCGYVDDDYSDSDCGYADRDYGYT
ncbi:uncharacterized protein [Montipora foliosa]